MPNTPYSAFIADLVRSRDIPDRAALQQRLGALLERLNTEHEADLVGRLVLVRGDEVQGLFRTSKNIVALVDALATGLYPERVQCGLGYGPVATGLVDDPAQMDGPCFHLARQALDRAKKQNSWLVACGFGSEVDVTVSTLFRLMAAIRHGWTQRQNELTSLARTMRQKEMAARLDVSPSVISESLKASSFKAVRAGEALAVQIFDGFESEREPGKIPRND